MESKMKSEMIEAMVSLHKETPFNKLPKAKQDEVVDYLPNIKIGNVEITKLIEEQLDKNKIGKLTNGITDEKEMADVINDIVYDEILNNSKIADVFERAYNELRVNKGLLGKLKELSTILEK